MASITLHPISFTDGGIIPSQFKNNAVCGEGNLSPAFTWDFLGVNTNHIAYFNLYVERSAGGGTSPNGKPLHWGVEHIASIQTSISDNGGWLASSNLVILSTDVPSGDRTNGWNGPCSSTPQFYNCWIEAKIYEAYYAYVFGKDYSGNGILKSDIVQFQDNELNVSEIHQTGDCGTQICPPGKVLIDGQCQEIITTPAQIGEITYTAVAKTNADWGWKGTIFYPYDNTKILPYKGNTNDFLEDSNNLALTKQIITTGLWKDSGTTDGRMNLVGIWTDNDPYPHDEWIGFCKCFNVETAGIYSIGISGDNSMRIKVNGSTIAEWWHSTNPQQYWHVVEIYLNAGMNIITLEGYCLDNTAGYGYEIYKATVAQLMALTTAAELNTSGYILYSSLDEVGNSFETGQSFSGHSCPNGYVYNSCDELDCIAINYTPAETIKCCWLIQACNMPDDTYLIRLSSNETTLLYGNHIYSFTGGTNLENKCFKVLRQEVCDTASYENITIVADLGESCDACKDIQHWQNCNSGIIVDLVLVINSITPTINNVYELNINNSNIPDGCYIYLGPSESKDFDQENVVIVTDYGTNDCNICKPCYIFNDCASQEIIVQLASTETPLTINQIGNIFHLSGNPTVEDQCYKLTSINTGCSNPLTDITIVDIIENCEDCTACYQWYKLTDCSNPQNTQFVYFNSHHGRLDENQVYIFTHESIDPNTCWSVTKAYNICEALELYMAYFNPLEIGPDNITTQYETCEDCNAICYKVTDCKTGEEFHLSYFIGLEQYVNSIIEWKSIKDNLIHCGLLSIYYCRNENLTGVKWKFIACHKTCDECDIKEISETFNISHRPVDPGYIVPPCEESKVNTSNTNICPNI